jgi:hypothetical protein
MSVPEPGIFCSESALSPMMRTSGGSGLGVGVGVGVAVAVAVAVEVEVEVEVESCAFAVVGTATRSAASDV